MTDIENNIALFPVKLPHGNGFRLIQGECLVNATEKTAYASFNYKGNETLKLSDHFPGKPIFPGAALLEAMAEAAIQIAQALPEMQGYSFYFAGIDKARFRKMIPAGVEIIYEVKIVGFTMGIGRAECKALVHGKLVCTALISFACSKN